MTLAEARKIVRAKYPDAFGWREFTVSDYEVKTDPGGDVIASAWYATHAWILAAERVNATPSTERVKK